MTNEKDEFIAMSEEELDQAAGGRRIVRVVGSPYGSPYGYGGMPGFGVPAPYASPYVAPPPVIAAPAPVLSPYSPYGYGYGMRLGTAL